MYIIALLLSSIQRFILHAEPRKHFFKSSWVGILEVETFFNLTYNIKKKGSNTIFGRVRLIDWVRISPEEVQLHTL